MPLPSSSLKKESNGGDLYVFGCGAPHKHTFAGANSVEEAFAKVTAPGWPVYDCTLEEITYFIEAV
jgi:hypothetical protein